MAFKRASAAGTRDDASTVKPRAAQAASMRSRSAADSGVGDTISVATLPRATSAMCCSGAAAPRSMSAPTASAMSRLVSDACPCENQRDTLMTPVGVSRSRKMCHASRV